MSLYFFVVFFSIFAASGLNYSLLGATWPVIHKDFGIALSFIGYINMTIAVGKVIASYCTAKLVQKFGTYKVALFGFFLICVTLFGYTGCKSYIEFFLWSIPSGFGNGFFICSFNAFSSIHLTSKNTNWLNMVWSFGATLGPYIMSVCLTRNGGWRLGYLAIDMLQLVFFVWFLTSWKKWKGFTEEEKSLNANKKKKQSAIRLKQMPFMIGLLFFYTATEMVSALWSSSYIIVEKGMSDNIGALTTTFLFAGITAGRLLSGFVSDKLGDRKMIYIGLTLIGIAGIGMFLATQKLTILFFVAIFGVGCGPIFPCIIHFVPQAFGIHYALSVVSILISCSQIATMFLPIAFGWVADLGGISLFPLVLVLFVVIMLIFLIFLKEKSCEE